MSSNPSTEPARASKGRIRSAIDSRKPARGELRRDAVASLPSAVSAVPDGLASATLVGVNPVFGIYSSMVGPPVGGLTASTRMMVVTTTTAAALAAGSALSSIPEGEDRERALVLLTALAGAVMIAAGLLKLGRFIRFVSRSVMLGFLSGVAVNIMLGQLPDLVGAEAEGSTSLSKAFNVLTDPGAWDPATAVIGIATLAALVGLAQTRLASVAALIAVAVPAIVVAVAGLGSVVLVGDAQDIPSGLPTPALPRLGDLSTDVAVGALSVAVIVLIQGAGVAQANPNIGGRRATNDGDFLAQGAANVAAGLFRGIPVGGSVSATALSRSSGARSRWAAILMGFWVLVVLVALSGLVSQVVSATLAAILLVAGAGSLRPRELLLIWKTGGIARIVLPLTFVATLALPVASAVAIGLGISLLLQLNQGALDLRLVERSRNSDGRQVETPAPQHLADGQLVVLEVYGSLLYAGARTLQRLLPQPGTATRTVVVLRLRGHTTIGATFLSVVAEYSDALAAGGGRFYLTGLDPEVVDEFHQGLAPDDLRQLRLVVATEVVGDSTSQAVEEGTAWLVGHEPAPRPDPSGPRTPE